MLARIDRSQTWSPMTSFGIPDRIEVVVDDRFVEMLQYLSKRAEEFGRDPLLSFAYVDQFLNSDTQFQWKYSDDCSDVRDPISILRYGVEESFVRFIGIDYNDGDPYLLWEAMEFDPDDMIAAFARGDTEFVVAGER